MYSNKEIQENVCLEVVRKIVILGSFESRSAYFIHVVGSRIHGERTCSLPSFSFPPRRGLANCRHGIVALLRNLITQLARVAQFVSIRSDFDS